MSLISEYDKVASKRVSRSAMEGQVLSLVALKQERGQAATARTIAEELGISRSEVLEILKKRGIGLSSLRSQSKSSLRHESRHGLESVTHKDIAKVAGVSTATVSLSLRNDVRIPMTTRGLVEQVAEDLGYRQSPFFRGLANMRWKNRNRGLALAYIGADFSEFPLLNRDGREGFVEQASGLGYHVDSYLIGDYPSMKALAGVLSSRGVVGAFFGYVLKKRSQPFLELMECLNSLGIRIVSQSEFTKNALATLLPDRQWQVETAFEEAVRYGGADVCYMDLKRSKMRVGYFRSSYTDLFPDQEPLILFRDDLDKGVFLKWIRKRGSKVVIGPSEAYEWVLEANARRKRKIGFISLTLNSDSHPDIAGIDMRHKDYGRIGAVILDLILRNNDVTVSGAPISVMLPAQWREGASLPCVDRSVLKARL